MLENEIKKVNSFYYKNIDSVEFLLIEMEDGTKKSVVNTTPHVINFRCLSVDGKTVDIGLLNSESVLLNAAVHEEVVGDDLVTTVFTPSPDGEKIINKIEEIWANDPDLKGSSLRIIGSIIACQAYPGKCQGMVPYPGFERVAPAEKRVRLDKFNVYRVK